MDYLPEIESDLSVFHRIEEIEQMTGPRFCALAPLLGAYPGALAARMAQARRDAEEGRSSPVVQVPQARQSPAGQVASLAEIAAMAGPSVSVGTSGGG